MRRHNLVALGRRTDGRRRSRRFQYLPAGVSRCLESALPRISRGVSPPWWPVFLPMRARRMGALALPSFWRPRLGRSRVKCKGHGAYASLAFWRLMNADRVLEFQDRSLGPEKSGLAGLQFGSLPSNEPGGDSLPARPNQLRPFNQPNVRPAGWMNLHIPSSR